MNFKVFIVYAFIESMGNDLRELVLFFYHTCGPGDWTQVVRLVEQCLYLLSRLSCPPSTCLNDLIISSCEVESSFCKSENWFLNFCVFPPRLQIITMKKEPAFFVVSYIFWHISKMNDIPIGWAQLVFVLCTPCPSDLNNFILLIYTWMFAFYTTHALLCSAF